MNPPKPNIVVAVLAVWAIGFHSLLLTAVWNKPVDRAITAMALGLLAGWVLVCGGLMWRFRGPLIGAAIRLPLGWRVRFVVLATSLALLEEAIATAMTNAGPLLGDPTGRAFITASTNYIEVVTQHSVVVFLPMFVAWALLLSWRSFRPFAVMMLFGVSGLLAEVLSFGPQNLFAGGFWVLVYGLMVALPAATVPIDQRPPARVWHYPIALVFPLVCAAPAALVLVWMRAGR